ncbi:lysylphosphatidylglycerol synthase domain-containing protein [Sphingomonas aliaeris]|uniref:lysylphosphatidylglycerol synthase domain-containing protein n=1 Tax=Sphingomonas aliaeris TaxID=2759526 RepID=UPI001CECA19F|nr:lysylphosphatidylglycerol synthase domain-containing protein [Sphingomonas aliaeris]
MLATLVGLAAAVWAFGSTGFANVLEATARIGSGGFVLFCLYSLASFVPLGAAWLAAAPGEPGSRLCLFTWARVLREAVADLLPFSQIGGIVVGTRSLMQKGIAPTRIYASLVVDMTTEMAAQLVFTLFGLALMASILMGHDAAALRPLILGGTGIMIAVMASFFIAQRPALALAERIAGHFLPGAAGTMAGLLETLRATYADRSRVIAAFGFNLLGWIASAFGAWLALHMMDVRISVWSVLSLESLIFTLRSVAFAIPAAIGVQEAAYALAAPLFGLPAETALALSLVKRARELIIGLPTLLLWQAQEAKAVVAARLR